MTDKEKLKKELIRLKDRYYKRGEESAALQDGYAMYWGGVISTFNEIITLVDSLPEEPVSEDLKEEIKKFAYTLPYSKTRSLSLAGWVHKWDLESVIQIGKHIAQWQKEQTINKAYEWLSKNFHNDEYWGKDDEGSYIDDECLIEDLIKELNK